MNVILTAPAPLPGVAPSLLGESPFWHPDEQALYWCDIAGRALNRWTPGRNEHRRWSFASEVGCAAPLPDGRVLLGLRDALAAFDPATERLERLRPAPYDPARQRFNDGKADPQGRFWLGSLDDAREPRAQLWRWADGRLQSQLHGFAVSNGLAWSPDARTMYWSDTRGHAVYAFDFDAASGAMANQRPFISFAPRDPRQPGAYVGRPDGAAVDVEGAYWCAMFEGRRLLRVAPTGRVLQELPLPVTCPTMPCFGGPDLRTLFITTAREHRPPEELAREPWAGCVLQLQVSVAGLPVNFARA